jgi:glycosyltransferase involved in cell wall biosynthesis
MRVLHLTSGNMYGGVETFLTTLAREAALVPDMHSEFALCWEGRLSRELSQLGTAPHVLGPVRISRLHTVVRARHALRKLLARERFDVVVCHQPWPCVVFGAVVRRARLPLVLWVHMAGEGTHWLERLARRTRPDLAICSSRFTAQCASRWLSQAHIEHVYCPVSRPDVAGCDTRAALRRRLKTPARDVVIVQVSRLEAFKGQRELLRALAAMKDQQGWTCWMVGGPQRPSESVYLRELQSIARASGIEDRVRFLGERSDVPILLNAADVYCQPNWMPEAFGLSLVEALHAGLPVVTSGIGGACEIVDGSCGVLTPPRDATALSAALGRLITDEHLRAQLGVHARLRPYEICDPTRQMRRIHELLSSLRAVPAA